LPPIKDCTGENAICSYTDTIQPIFEMYCIKCHDGQARLEGGLDLTSYSACTDNRSEDNQVIIGGDIENSKIWQRITHESSPMPPSGIIDDKYIIMITKWIEAGAINN